MSMLPRCLTRLRGFSPRMIGQSRKPPRRDGSTALVVFIATVGFAPHVGIGIVVGAAVALVIYWLP